MHHFQCVRGIGGVEHRGLSPNISYCECLYMPVSFNSVAASNSQSNVSFHFVINLFAFRY
jgi:hypothetical protein